MKRTIAAVLLSQLALALPAQTTHTIKLADLQATIGAARAGDIILITDPTGPVLGDIVVDKPLFIHGRGASLFFFSPSVQIRSIPRGGSVAFTGFRNVPRVQVTGCAGRVLLSDLRAPNAFGHVVTVNGCADVAITGCWFGSISFNGSRGWIESSRAEGTVYSPRTLPPGTSGVYATGSALTIVDSDILGGAQGQDLPALLANQATIWSHGSVFRNRLFGGAARAIEGTGSLLYDPSVRFSSTNQGPVDPRILAGSRRLPVLSMAQTPIGAPAAAALLAQPGSPFVLFFGAPGDRVVVPGIGGSLDVAQPVLLQLGVMPPIGFTQFAFRVPDVPALRGWLFRWQGIAQQGAVVDWSNAVTECHY